MICIGFDPGLDGAVAFLYPDHDARVEDLPTRPREGGGVVHRVLDALALYRLLANNLDGGAAIASIENVHMRPGGGGVSMGSLVDSRARIEAVLELARLGSAPAIEPAKWKRYYRLKGGPNKRPSLDVARTLFPRLAVERLARVKDHNRAEALLIAHYLRSTLE